MYFHLTGKRNTMSNIFCFSICFIKINIHQHKL